MRQLLPFIFLILFLGLLVGANMYLSRRFSLYFGIENISMLYAVFITMTLMMMFGVMPLSNATSSLANLVYVVSAVVMGVFLYVLLSVLTVDFLSLFATIPPKIRGVSVLMITLLVASYGIYNSWNVTVTHQEVKLKGLTKEIKAMHLSDIHIGHFRGKNFLKKIIDKTNAQNVDVVFITGDLFDGRINLTKKELLPFTQLNAPVYFVEGNHDRYTGVDTVKQFLKDVGVRILENETQMFGELQIVGLNHMRADSSTYNMHAAGNSSTIKSVLESLALNKEKPTVLLHHSPDGIKYANMHGVDLYLAGHTHAGQLFPIKYIANLMFDYNQGLHDYKGTKIFVSQGTGTFGPPMRVGTKSEIALITLKPE